MKRRTALIAFAAACSSTGLADVARAQDAQPQSPAGSGAAGVAKPGPTPGDPWEPANRRLYGFSSVIDKFLFRPVAMTYRRVLPGFVRSAAHNVVSNLGEPGNAVNDLLQGKVKRAGTSSARFLTNTTIGVAGIFDVAQQAGLNRQENDFGLTLGRWNLDSGPYVYVPVAGPSSVRDATGSVVDFFLDPVGWVSFRDSGIFHGARAATGALDTRVRVEPALQQLHRVAIDPYATMRSVYLQSRESEVRDGVVDMEALPDIPEEETQPLEDQAMSEPASAPPTEGPLGAVDAAGVPSLPAAVQ